MQDFAASGKPPFINRKLSMAEWRAYVAAYDFGSRAPDRVVLHHTAVPTLDQWAGLSTMQGMQRYYGGMAWFAGPHIYAAPDGIWLATPMNLVGVHANGGNANLEFQSDWFNYKKLQWYSIGVEMVGNYEKVQPSGAVWENTTAVLGALCQRFGRTPEQAISFHRDYTNQKTCPGTAVQKPWVSAAVNEWLVTQQPRKVWTVTLTQPTYIYQDRTTNAPIALNATAHLAAGATVEVDDLTNGWLHTASQIGFFPERATQSPPQQATAYRVHDNSQATLRDAPNRQGAIVRTLPAGTVVQVVGAVQGQNVAGTDVWYLTDENLYVHSGAVKQI